MKNTLFLFLILFLFFGCATAKKTSTPDGSPGYVINCHGTALSWGECYEKAGEICGSNGYDVLSKTGDQGAVFSGTQFGVFGGSVITRSMVIKCKNSITNQSTGTAQQSSFDEVSHKNVVDKKRSHQNEDKYQALKKDDAKRKEIRQEKTYYKTPEKKPKQHQISSEELYLLAKGMRNSNPKRSIELCTQAIEIDPRSAKIYNERGYAYIKVGDYFNACNDFYTAYKLGDPFGLRWAKAQNYCN